jgi:hypothetical protein
MPTRSVADTIVAMTGLATWAVALAERMLSAEFPRRWRHDLGAVAKARIAAHVVGDDADLLVAAAALHDLGHAPQLADTGFGPLDAARYLRREGAPDRLVALVANNAGGSAEAAMRGLVREYESFPDEGSLVTDALWWACLTTGSDGSEVTVQDRIAGWATSYAGDDIVAKWAANVAPTLIAAVERTRARVERGTAP